MGNIKAIYLPEIFDNYINAEGDPLGYLRSISNINIFVGENNSGKSRFARMLSGQSEYQLQIDKFNQDLINKKVYELLDILKSLFAQYNLTVVNNFNIGQLDKVTPLPYCLIKGSDTYKHVRGIFNELKGITKITNYAGNPTGGVTLSLNNQVEFTKQIRDLSIAILSILEQVPQNPDVPDPHRVYIPVLRGLRPITLNHEDIYSVRIETDYFTPKSELAKSAPKLVRPEIFTGLSFFQKLTDLLLGTNQERRIISRYQGFISKYLFGGKSIALIPKQKDKVVVVKIGNEKEQPIFDLGDGIQSLIILSFLPYISESPTFFFIEEPEMYLHPGLQRKILSFFNSLNQHMFFLTTHSNHFLDLTMDIKDVSIFTFKKQLPENKKEDDEIIPKFIIESISNGDRSSLELLGVRNSSVFLVNATIWVEGICDRLYLRAMLNSYITFLKDENNLEMEIEEDLHYSFVEYAGSNITHWSFLEKEEHPIEVKRLCSKALVIVDKDGDSKLERKKELEKMLNDRLVILPCREVENLLPYSVIKEVIMDYENNRALPMHNIEYTEYRDEYLGGFIENNILERKFTRTGGYQSSSGTLKSKVDFCEKAVSRIKYSELPSDTQVLVQKIYKFILSQNK